MAYQSVFSTKKTQKPLFSPIKPVPTQNQQMYSPVNPLPAATSQKPMVSKPSYSPTSPIDTMKSMLTPKSYATPAPKTTTTLFTAPKSTGIIYGSSKTDPRYANFNPQTPKIDTPAVEKPTVKQTPQPTASENRLSFISSTADKQKQFAEEQRKQQEDYIRQQYGLANSQLMEQVPAAREQFNQFKTNTEQTIGDLLAGGERQKGQASDYYGEAQRLAAKTLRETQGDTQRTFSGLNTLDSRGEGSFDQANTNVMSDFNRTTQQNLKSKADKLSEIDQSVSSAVRSAQQTIVQENAKLTQLERDIQYAMANNNLQQARELTDAYNTTKQYIYDIADNVNNMQYQFSLEKEKLASEMVKAKTFTPQFMSTGVPTNQAEYEFLVKNKKNMDSLYGAADNKSSGKVNSIADKLLGMNTRGITGRMRLGFSDESRNAKGLLNQLSSELQLEEAKRLKGQGSMSDAERAILANAVASFNFDKEGNPQVSDERFQEILQELKTGMVGNTNNDPLGIGL